MIFIIITLLSSLLLFLHAMPPESGELAFASKNFDYASFGNLFELNITMDYYMQYRIHWVLKYFFYSMDLNIYW